MPPILFHIYGPIAIHSFGVMICLGLIIALYFMHKDTKLSAIISGEQLTTIFQIGFIAGITGGRIWFLLLNWSCAEHWTDYFMVWNGGLSILGCIIGILIALGIYLHQQHLPVLAILDRIALYTPLLQSISRLGCFFAGCCFGMPTAVPWSVIYTDQTCLAPLHIHIHPTQLYSSLFLLCSFIILLIIDRFFQKKQPGFILAWYIILSSLDRFCIDFFRGDREFFEQPTVFGTLSIQQALALCMCMTAICMIIYISSRKKKYESI